MNPKIKRLFINTKINYSSNFENICIKCEHEYIISKFLNELLKKLYSLNFNLTCIYQNFKTDYLNQILINDLNLSLSPSKSNHIIDLSPSLKFLNKIELSNYDSKINSLKKTFIKDLNNLKKMFVFERENAKKFLDMTNINEFCENLIKDIFKTNTIGNEFYIEENIISSIGIYGFKTFSSNIFNNENKVFILNDEFNLLKHKIINKILNKAYELNLFCEVYKNNFDFEIDHIKIPSLSFILFSNSILFKENFPGIKINIEGFLNTHHYDKKIFENLNKVYKSLQENYLLKETYLENSIINSIFNDLINETLKNVIR